MCTKNLGLYDFPYGQIHKHVVYFKNMDIRNFKHVVTQVATLPTLRLQCVRYNGYKLYSYLYLHMHIIQTVSVLWSRRRGVDELNYVDDLHV